MHLDPALPPETQVYQNFILDRRLLNDILTTERGAIRRRQLAAVLTKVKIISSDKILYIVSTGETSEAVDQPSNYWLTVILGSELAT